MKVELSTKFKNRILPWYDKKYRNPPKHLHPAGEFISDNIRRNSTYYELPLLHFLRKNADFSTVVDVGANIGNHSKFFTEFGEDVFSVEPIKRNYSLLTMNAPSATAFNIGVGDSVAQLEFVTFESCLGNSYASEAFGGAVNNWGDGVGKELVDILPLDDLDLPAPTLLKLDVEGFELRALRGGERLLTQSKATKICIELHRQADLEASNFEYSRDEVVSLLKEFGYAIHKQIDETNFLFEKK